MKILIATVLTEAFYKSRRELIENFIELGYEVVLVAPELDKNIDLVFDKQKVTFHKVDFDRNGLSINKDLNTIKSLNRLLKLERPNIVYSFGGAKAAIYTTIASNLCRINKIVCMINGLGSIYRGSGLKNKIIKIIMNKLFRYSLSKADGVIFQNKDDLDIFVEYKLVEREKCKIVNGSGVNLEKFKYQKPDINKPIFLFVGRLLRDKGIYEFIETAKVIKKEFVNSQFWVVGGIDSNPTSVSKKELESWVRMGYIEYFGRVSEVIDYYKKASVFILPSYHEGTPRTNLEAMAVGRPIITTDAPGCRETVINGTNGFLIPIKDVAAIIDKVKIYINEPLKIIEMGIESHKLAVEKYNVINVNKSIIDFITK